jgi:methionyl-tRNA formyltransferase
MTKRRVNANVTVWPHTLVPGCGGPGVAADLSSPSPGGGSPQGEEDLTRLIFMGSPRFAVPSLHALVRRGHEIALVVTQPTRPAGRGKQLHQPPVAALAEHLGLPLFQPERIRPPAVVARLQQVQPEAIVVAAYGQILPPSVLSIPPLGCINVHPSLLPRHRGAAPIAASILAGDSETGVTIMLMDEGMDTGPLLSAHHVPLGDDDDQVTLTSRLALLGGDLLVETLADLEASRISPQAQNNEQATTSRPVNRNDAVLDWSRPAVDLWRQVRAFAEWPQATTWWGRRALRILAARYDDTSSGALNAGQVAPWGLRSRTPQAIAIGTGRGFLLPHVVGIEGKRVMPIEVFLRGQASIVGAQLGSAPVA